MENKLTKSKVFNIVASTMVGIVGILVVVFAILRWAEVNDLNPNLAIRIVFGVGCLLLGLTLAVVSLVKTNRTLEITGLAVGSSLTALGIFMFFDEAGAVMDTILGLVTPIALVTGAAYLLVKAIISLCEKLNKKVCIFYIVVSAIIITLGILLIVFREKLINLIWIVVGLAMIFGSLLSIIKLIKGENEENSKHKEKEEPIEQPEEEAEKLPFEEIENE